MFHFFRLASFSCEPSSCCALSALHVFDILLFLCCTFFMLYSFHVVLFLCCTICMLLLCVALFSCCTFFVLHSFHDALSSVHFFWTGFPYKTSEWLHLFNLCLIETCRFLKKYVLQQRRIQKPVYNYFRKMLYLRYLTESAICLWQY